MESSDSWTSRALDWLFTPGPEPRSHQLSESIAESTGPELSQFVEAVAESLHQHGSPAELGPRMRILLQWIAARTLRLRLENSDGELDGIVDTDALAELAVSLKQSNHPQAAAHCLQILAAQADRDSLAELCNLLAARTVEDDRSIAVAVSPLFQWPPPGLAQVFDSLGENLWNLQLIGPMLDLAAHCLRKGKLTAHPLKSKIARLRELLGASVQRLAVLEEKPQQFGNDVATIQQVLSGGVALTVSLCDALGLMNDQESEIKLMQAMELSHRRVQTEAACALARLGKEAGRRRLIELTGDPAARLRAVAYADELGLEEEVPAEMREPIAMAESEAIAWLSESERFGFPPAELELIDQRTQFWPSYDTPQACFLWRFAYRFAQGELSNLIIAGPLVHAFHADLKRLDVDDVYGLFAGWQAEHNEIYEVPSSQFNSAQRSECDRLLKKAAEENTDIDQWRALALTFFFGERAVLAVGQRSGQNVCLVVDDLEQVEQDIDSRPTSLTPELVLCLYRGRKLLRSFN